MKLSTGGRAGVFALALLLAIPSQAHAGWWFSKPKPAAVSPVKEQLPAMVADGHDLTCIQALLRAKDMEAWKAAKQKYYEASPRAFPSVLWGAVAWTLTGVLAVTIGTQLAAEPERGFLAALLVPLGMYAADWFSALYHKFVDSFANEKHPLWGNIARDFRVHHEDPNQILGATYGERLADNAKPVVPLLAGTLALVHQGIIGPELATGIWSFLLFGMHGAVFHQYAHTKTPPAFVRLLQTLHLALQREAHMDHHRAPFDETYGVVNGWSEPLAQSFDLWKRLDKLYWKYSRRMPGNWIQDPRSIPDEVVKELEKDSESIPHELWAYSLTAFPNRVPEELKEPLSRVQARWRREFVALRQKEYREVAQHDRPLAERMWKQELADFAWIYGPNAIGFDETEAETR